MSKKVKKRKNDICALKIEFIDKRFVTNCFKFCLPQVYTTDEFDSIQSTVYPAYMFQLRDYHLLISLRKASIQNNNTVDNSYTVIKDKFYVVKVHGTFSIEEFNRTSILIRIHLTSPFW